jgi:ABC-type sugar transport system substrate-binding protein
MPPKHPDITVTLTGQDGNAFAVLGRCREAAREAGLSEDEIAAFMDEAMAGDYEHLLKTAMRWFEVR